MPLSITSRVEDNVAILDLSGPLTLGPSLVSLRETARRSLNERKLTGLILHCGQVTLTDSAGLGELTVVYTFASKHGCPLLLAEARPGLKKALQITRLDALLPVVNDVPTAKLQLLRK
jgi:anti-anti-sigma factor